MSVHSRQNKGELVSCVIPDLHETAQQAHYSKYKLISTTDTEQLITAAEHQLL